MEPDSLRPIRKFLLYAFGALLGSILLYLLGGGPAGYYVGYHNVEFGQNPHPRSLTGKLIGFCYLPLWKRSPQLERITCYAPILRYYAWCENKGRAASPDGPFAATD